MSYLDVFDDIEQEGAGIEADLEGQPFNVYRLSANTPPMGVLSDVPVATVNAILERTTSRKGVENQTFDLILATATVDNGGLQLGDILVESGYRSDGSAWCFVQYRPLQETLFIRCETRVYVKRPVDLPARSSGIPGSWIAVPGLAEDNEATSDELTIIAGQYVLMPTRPSVTPALVPFGLQPTSRARPGRQDALPSSTELARFVGYLPPLGLVIRPGDKLEIQDGSNDAYAVEQAFSTAVGLVGTTMLLTKVGL